MAPNPSQPSLNEPRPRRPRRGVRLPRISDVSELVDLSRTHASAAEAVRYAVQNLAIALAGSRCPSRCNSWTYYEWRRDLPYFIHDSGLPNTQILVNREYKPLGSNLSAGLAWTRYEEFPNLHVRLSARQIDQVRLVPYPSSLFGDGSAPWLGRYEAKAYLQRLIRLLEILNIGERVKEKD